MSGRCDIGADAAAAESIPEVDEDVEPEETVCMERWAHDLMQRESMIVVRGSGLRQLCLTSCLAGTDNPRDTVFFHGYI
jgi:hypothetical protein